MTRYCKDCKTSTNICDQCPRRKPHCGMCGDNYYKPVKKYKPIKKKVVKKAPKKYTVEDVNKAYDAGWDAACVKIISLVDDEKK
jgi:hypothetical protein